MNKKVNKYLDNYLEDKYHMNDRLDNTKTNLVFNSKKTDKKNDRYLKFKYTIICFVICMVLSTCTFLLTKHYYKDTTHNVVINMKDYNEKANEYISKQCDTFYSIPLLTYSLEQDFFLSIYEGEKNNNKIYFYQFGSYISSKYLVDIVFYNAKNQYMKIENIVDYDIGLISNESFDTDVNVYFNYYRNNELRISSQLF